MTIAEIPLVKTAYFVIGFIECSSNIMSVMFVLNVEFQMTQQQKIPLLRLRFERLCIVALITKKYDGEIKNWMQKVPAIYKNKSHKLVPLVS